MSELVNGDRSAHGLKRLRYDERLAEVARSHSVDMMTKDFFAHISPTRGTMDDRMARAGLKAAGFAENLAQNRDLHAAQKGLMESPAHRRAILGDYDRIGIGVVRREDGQLFITQNFAGDFPKVDLAAEPARLLREINEWRDENDRKPLREMEVFSEIAEENSEAMLRLGELGTERAKQLLESKKPGMRFCRILVFKSTGPPEAKSMAQALEKQYSIVGIGMAAEAEAADGGYLWTTILLVQR